MDRFTFQTMVIFVESLALAHTDEKSLGELGITCTHKHTHYTNL